MQLELTPEQNASRQRFRDFVAREVAPFAAAWDREGAVPLSIVDRLREAGLLATLLGPENGGAGFDALTYALLTEEMGRGCSSVRSLLTVHDMAAVTVRRWGKPRLKDEVLPELAAGRRLGALALSEPNAGSDPSSIETRAVTDGDGYRLSGRKKWMTFGEIADEFLVLARLTVEAGEELTAFLVPATAQGFSRRPIRGMVGTRASRLAEIELEDCRVEPHRLIGRPGTGLSHVIATALDHGRFSVACGAVGIAEACLQACMAYASSRVQGGKRIAEHQLVSRRLTDMIVETRAARLLCWRAAHMRQTLDPSAVPETMIAKYYASRAACRIAESAIQLHGANGLSEEFPLERLARDAKVTEMIEGSTEIQQISIPRYAIAEL